MRHVPRPGRRPGFTLMELLVVVAIVVLVSAVALPVILPALSNRQVIEGARILQGALVGARDSAIRHNGVRGVRLIPDPTLTGLPGGILASNRMIAIEPAPDITEGFVTFPSLGSSWADSSGKALTRPPFPFPFPGDPNYLTALGLTTRGFYPFPPTVTPMMVLMIEQATFVNNDPRQGPNPPTNWFWNVRIGDKFRFSESGRTYTVVGPMTVANPEFFVNDGLPGPNSTLLESYNDQLSSGKTINVRPDFLFLVNGVDDDGDGIVDNGLNGVDEDPLATANSSYPIIPDNIGEWTETEKWLGSQAVQSLASSWSIPFFNGTAGTTVVPPQFSYVISRRPVPVQTAQEVALPSAVVIDMTGWNTTRERSRLPVDPNTFTVDIMVNQSGQVVPTTTYSTPAATTMDSAFYHFWIADRSDVYAPSGAVTSKGAVVSPQLPIPVVADPSNGRVLKKDRQLVTLFTRTGQLVTNSVENFDFADAYGATATPYYAGLPFMEAQLGIREAK